MLTKYYHRILFSSYTSQIVISKTRYINVVQEMGAIS